MILWTLLKQDLRLGLRQRLDLVLLVVFTLVSALLFPMAIGPEPQILARVAVGLIWVLVLFATHMAVPMVWRQDVEDGSLEQLCLAGFPLEWIVLSKVLCVWLLTFGSLFMLLPFICVVMGMDALSVWVVMKAFFLVSLPLSFLTVTGGLMTQGRSRSAILSIIILLPLYLPLLIFSCGAGDAARLGQECGVYLTILAGLSLVMAPMLLYANVILLRWRPE